MEEVTNESAIRVIKNLPDLRMKYSGLILPRHSNDTNEQKLLDSIRESHHYHADWLEYYLLNKVDLLPELTFTRKVHFKAYAERSYSYLRLAREVLLRSEDAQERKLTPLLWMLHIEVKKCDTRLKNSYYAPSDAPLGKKETYDLTKGYYDALQHEVGKVSQDTIEEKTVSSALQEATTITAEQFLECEASRLARSDPEFRNTYYASYCKEQKRFARQIRDNKRFHFIYMDENSELQELTNGVRRGDKRKRASKGFG
jgi:hypothetical protein